MTSYFYILEFLFPYLGKGEVTLQPWRAVQRIKLESCELVSGGVCHTAGAKE